MPKRAIRVIDIRKAVDERGRRHAEAAVLCRAGESLISSYKQDANAGGIQKCLRGQCDVTRAELLDYEADMAVCKAVIEALGPEAVIEFRSSTDVRVTYVHSEHKSLDFASKKLPTKGRR
jgi:hypothetical protein